MDERRRALIVTSAVLLLILALLIGGIFLVARFFQNRTVNPSPSPVFPPASSSASPLASGQPTDQTIEGQQEPALGDVKVLKGSGFQMNVSKSWGILTCSNSSNFELDPTNSQDQQQVACNRAIKPITVLITNNLSCEGETAYLGEHLVARSFAGNKGGGEVDYRWCVINPNGPDLDITHRVSQTSQPAVSKNDYSQQIEEMISKIKFQ